MVIPPHVGDADIPIFSGQGGSISHFPVELTPLNLIDRCGLASRVCDLIPNMEAQNAMEAARQEYGEAITCDLLAEADSSGRFGRNDFPPNYMFPPSTSYFFCI